MTEKKIDLSAVLEATKREPSVLAGRVTGGYASPGSMKFESFVKKVANAMSRVGECKSFVEREIYGVRHTPDVSDDVAKASEKIAEAHKLLLGAEALLRSSHVQAKTKEKK